MPNIHSPPSGERLAVAVSGGADSMALLRLLHAKNIPLHALTVDHGLRPESAFEAAQVAQWCKDIGIAHTTLIWNHDILTTRVQEKAREARYEIMTRWCLSQGIRHLALAHHADDQMETFLLRLLGKSHMEGLCGMLPITIRDGVQLVRPLLHLHKKNLIEYLHSIAQSWIEDPSNQAEYYTRTHTRTLLASLSEDQKTRLEQMVAFFGRWREGIERKTTDALVACATLHAAGYAALNAGAFAQLPPEIQRHTLTYLLLLISGDATPPRTEKIARLCEAMRTPRPGQKHTLHGVALRYQAKNNRWLLVREIARVATPVMLSGALTLWDGRFLVTGTSTPHTVRALGAHAAHHAKALEASDIPKSVWPTLPAIFHLEECIAIPHIDYKASGVSPQFAVESQACKLLGNPPSGVIARAE